MIITTLLCRGRASTRFALPSIINKCHISSTSVLASKNFDAKFNKLTQHVADVKSDIGRLKTLLEQERRDKRIERALKLTHLGSFNYYDEDYDDTDHKNSSDLAKEVLGWFLLGYGYNLPEGMMQQYPNDNEASKKAFRDNFKEQIRDLIGREPRLGMNEDGSYYIQHGT